MFENVKLMFDDFGLNPNFRLLKMCVHNYLGVYVVEKNTYTFLQETRTKINTSKYVFFVPFRAKSGYFVLLK